MPETILLQASREQESDVVAGRELPSLVLSFCSIITHTHTYMHVCSLSISPSTSETNWRDLCCSNLLHFQFILDFGGGELASGAQ